MFVVGVEALLSPSIAEFRKSWGWILVLVLAEGAATDAVIAMSLCWFLVKHRRTSLRSLGKRAVMVKTWTIGVWFDWKLLIGF